MPKLDSLGYMFCHRQCGSNSNYFDVLGHKIQSNNAK